jgi:hypothetical protein
MDVLRPFTELLVLLLRPVRLSAPRDVAVRVRVLLSRSPLLSLPSTMTDSNGPPGLRGIGATRV